MGESTFLTVLRVVTTITSVLVCLAPLPDVLRVCKQRHTGDMSVLPLVMIFSNSHIWAIYGYLVSNIFPLFVQCVIGEAANLIFIGLYYKHSTTTDRRKVFRMCAIAVSGLVIVTVYVILATAGVTHESHREIEKIMGYISVVTNICMYGSPLEIMRNVIRIKSAAALPIAFSAMSFLNCALWVAFGIADHDMFVLTPNAIATVLSAIQIALYLIYPPRKDAINDAETGLANLEQSGANREVTKAAALSPVVANVHVQIKTPTSTA